MKRIAIYAGLTLALAAPALAQDAPQAMPPEENQTTKADALIVEPTRSSITIMPPAGATP